MLKNNSNKFSHKYISSSYFDTDLNKQITRSPQYKGKCRNLNLILDYYLLDFILQFNDISTKYYRSLLETLYKELSDKPASVVGQSSI